MKAIVVILFIFSLFSCADQEQSRTFENSPSLVETKRDMIDSNNRETDTNELEFEDLTIKKTKIMGWWWKKSVAQKGIDADDPPPKDQYVEIVILEYDGEGITTFPEKIDLVSELINGSKKSKSGFVRFYVRGRFGDYDAINYGEFRDGTKGEARNCESYPWAKEELVLEQSFQLKSKEESKFKKSEFQLTPLLIKEIDGNRICSFELIVKVFDSGGNREIASDSKTIAVKLGD